MSDFTARREARIRKILKNSSTRLKKIANITDDFIDETPSTSIDEVVPLKIEKEIINESVPITSSSNEDGMNVIFEDDGRSYRTSEPALEIPDSRLYAPVRYVLIVLLAIFIRHIILIANYMQETDFLTYYRLNNIFLPFFTFEVIDFTFFKPFIQRFNYLNILYLLNLGISSEYISNFIIIAQILLQVMQDVMVYFFTFVCFGGFIDLISS